MDTLTIIILIPLLALAVSAAYFVASADTQPLWQRLLAAAHGVNIAGLFLATIAISIMGLARPAFRQPFLFALGGPILLIIVSLWIFKGKKAIHLLQAVNLLALAGTLFIGIMAVTGDWL